MITYELQEYWHHLNMSIVHLEDDIIPGNIHHRHLLVIHELALPATHQDTVKLHEGLEYDLTNKYSTRANKLIRIYFTHCRNIYKSLCQQL